VKTENQSKTSPFALSIAPMMDWTTRHCRYFHRLLSPHARLYTEMVTTGALIHGDRKRHLDFDASEHPVALQLGGSEPDDLAACARMGADWGYNEINLNCGCPSERVQKGAFGACLMREPQTVAGCVAAMRAAVPAHVPVTVKCRIGVDDVDAEPFLNTFIQTVHAAGCDTFIIHARKAWLKGLSPKENREVPPLDYNLVARIKARYPHMTVILNGGLTTVEQVVQFTSPLEGEVDPPTYTSPFKGEVGGGSGGGYSFDGVMIGREAYHNPYFIAELEHALYGTPLPNRDDIAAQMADYIARVRAQDPEFPAHAVTRHMLGLYHGMPGARAWRRRLTEGGAIPAQAGIQK
jgi:tRNA-dihydrouridine synthase A